MATPTARAATRECTNRNAFGLAIAIESDLGHTGVNALLESASVEHIT